MPARVPMTNQQRSRLLTLPDTEAEVVRHHSLSADDLLVIREARTPETRLGYALQLCVLRYPGRHLRRGELLPAAMLDHIAEQIGVHADALADFARRGPTRYEQLAAIKRRHGFRDLTAPVRAELRRWLAGEAIGTTDGRFLLDRLIDKMRTGRIVIPGVSVVERLAAKAMHAADRAVIAGIGVLLSNGQRSQLDAVLSDKEHARLSRLSWLREPPGRTALPRSSSCSTSSSSCAQRSTQPVCARGLSPAHGTDGARGRAARREETLAASADQGRERLLRIANVLEALAKAAKKGGDIVAAMTAIAPLEVIEADAALIRRTTRLGRPDVLGELTP